MALANILSHSLSRNEHRSTPAMRSSAHLSKNLNRLISAAVVSPRFQRLLLSDPVVALAVGYNGESFQLTPAEYAAVTSMRVGSVRDLAAHLLRILPHPSAEPVHHAAELQADFRFAEVAG